MKRLAATLTLAFALALTGCSTSEVDVEPIVGSDGKCKQTREDTTLGIFHKTREYVINC